MSNSYTPVPYVFFEMIEEAKARQTDANIHYFDENDQIEAVKGKIAEWKAERDGDFLHLDSGARVRLDNIITLYGKPGPAFDKYDAFANACLDCYGGWHF